MKQKTRSRADYLLLAQGLAETEAKARALIMAGSVYAGTRRIEKPAEMLPASMPLHVKGKGHDYVSRGALKLAAALDHFGINPEGLTGLDIGASTGGFTEVLLRRGARHVHAVDAGTNQLDWKLRSDPRVTSLERCDARALTPALIPLPPQIITADISFIGLTLALPAALRLAAPDACAVLLIKPQFELQPHEIPKGGVVTDAAARQAICDKIHRWLRDDMGWTVLGLIPSPITGQDGNQEYLIAARRMMQ